MLATIVSLNEIDEATKLFAAIVLKNTLRNHVIDIKAMPANTGANNELNNVKHALM